MKKSSKERIEKFIQKKGSHDCWPWQGCKNNSGYGLFRHKGRMWVAHRAMADLEGMLIDEAAEVHHLCCNYLCVNPQHLTIGTIETRPRRTKNHA